MSLNRPTRIGRFEEGGTFFKIIPKSKKKNNNIIQMFQSHDKHSKDIIKTGTKIFTVNHNHFDVQCLHLNSHNFTQQISRNEFQLYQKSIFFWLEIKQQQKHFQNTAKGFPIHYRTNAILFCALLVFNTFYFIFLFKNPPIKAS